VDFFLPGKIATLHRRHCAERNIPSPLFASEPAVDREIKQRACNAGGQTSLADMSNVISQGREARPLVLVVEDDFLVRTDIAAFLESCGFAVLQASNADEAIARLQHDRRVAAMFSDIQMDGSMDGAGLAEWSRCARPDVKVLLTSGRSLPAEVRHLPMLAKPYQPIDVVHELRRLISAG
jgi:CheY-like chemotaxis protein